MKTNKARTLSTIFSAGSLLLWAALSGPALNATSITYDFEAIGSAQQQVGRHLSFSEGGQILEAIGIHGPNYKGIGVILSNAASGLGVTQGNDAQIDFLGPDAVLFKLPNNYRLTSVLLKGLGVTEEVKLFTKAMFTAQASASIFATLTTRQGTSLGSGNGVQFSIASLGNLIGLGAAADSNTAFRISAVTISAVPVPPAVLLFFTGLLALGFAKRQRAVEA